MKKLAIFLAAFGALVAIAFGQTSNQVVNAIVATTCTNQFIRSITASGAGTCASVAAATDVTGLATVATSGSATDLGTGTLPEGRMPALTGNCTTSVGTVATSCNVTSQIVGGTRDLTAANGTQDVTFGFTPTACEGMGTINNSAGTTYTTHYSVSDSIGGKAAFAAATSTTVSVINTAFFYAADAAGTSSQLATISYGTNKATLSWTKTGSPTGTFTFFMRCFK